MLFFYAPIVLFIKFVPIMPQITKHLEAVAIVPFTRDFLFLFFKRNSLLFALLLSFFLFLPSCSLHRFNAQAFFMSFSFGHNLQYVHSLHGLLDKRIYIIIMEINMMKLIVHVVLQLGSGKLFPKSRLLFYSFILKHGTYYSFKMYPLFSNYSGNNLPEPIYNMSNLYIYNNYYGIQELIE